MSIYYGMFRAVKRILPLKTLAASLGGLGVASGIYLHSVSSEPINFVSQFASFSTMSVRAESKVKHQEMVVAPDKVNGLFVIIHLKPSACPKSCVKALQKLETEHIDRVSPKDIRDEDSEIIMGVGFGPEFLEKIYPDYTKAGVIPFPYKERQGKNVNMPATGGDILIHAVCTEKGKLFELVQAVTAEIPEKDIDKIVEIYGFRYRNGRDLSGFIDGTENPADEDERIAVAVNSKTSGSYIIAQRWIHDLKKMPTIADKVMEKHIGRTKPDSVELSPVQPSSHVGRITYGLSDAKADEYRLVRHSMPYGYVTGEAGLFFIGYASKPSTLDWMLDRMTGLRHDKIEDGLFNFTKPVSGAFFYAPSLSELKKIYKEADRKKSGFW